MKQFLYLMSLLNVHGMATDDVACRPILKRVHISKVITVLPLTQRAPEKDRPYTPPYQGV